MLKLGIGTTGKCNMRCDHCYSRRYDNYELSFDQIRRISESIDMESVNFGTGENILNPDFKRIAAYLYEKGVDLSITTNGYSITKMTDEELRMFHDIDFSLEYPKPQLQNHYRGHNSWNMVLTGMDRCTALGIPFSVATVLMKANAGYICDFYDLISHYKCFLRLNVVKCDSGSMEKASFDLTYDLFWNSMKEIFSKYAIVSCSEPILCAALGLDSCRGVPCGNASVRIQPDGSVLPCVYWGASSLNIEDLIARGEAVLETQDFRETQRLPEFCSACTYVSVCHGGCASRRKLGAGITLPDPFCPIAQKKEFPRLSFTAYHEKTELIHSTYLCTIILGTKQELRDGE